MRTELYYKVKTGKKYYSGNNEWKEDIRYFDDFLKAYNFYLGFEEGATITKVNVTLLEFEASIDNPGEEYKKYLERKNNKFDFNNMIQGVL